jgi:alkylhydroperoxidase family enzyme
LTTVDSGTNVFLDDCQRLTGKVKRRVLKDLVILRVSQRCKGEYAWVQHAAIAKTVGVSDAQIAALERGEISLDLFNVRERVTFAFADEVVDRAFATEDTFAAMHRMFSPRELLELLLLIGYFRMICGVMTTMGVEVESPFGGRVLDLVRKTAARKETPAGPSARKSVGVALP